MHLSSRTMNPINNSDRRSQINPLTILVVDDIKVNYLLIKAMTGQLFADVVYFSNGIEAIDYIKAGNKVDFILMDYNMPGMDGIEATLIIKDIRPQLPIISMSTFTDSPHFDRKSAPYDGYLSKPVDPELLMSFIERLTKYKS
jgi:CheY-like chemotaxis protein